MGIMATMKAEQSSQMQKTRLHSDHNKTIMNDQAYQPALRKFEC